VPDNSSKKLLKQIEHEKKQRLTQLSVFKKKIIAYQQETFSLLEKLSLFSKTSPAEIQEELVSDIRLLGDGVATSLRDVNKQFENFTESINQKLINSKKDFGQTSEPSSAPIQITESLEPKAFELVPPKSIEKLAFFFKQ